MNQRFLLIDKLRGVAVALMIFFHFSYDLSSFQFITIDFKNNPFWFYLPRLIVVLFFTSAGASLYFAHGPPNQIQWNKFLKREIQLFICSALISISTYFLFPKTWVYFGTLHSLFVCSIMALPFLKRPPLAFIVAFIILIPAVIFNVKFPWPTLPHFSMDYIPALPWVGVIYFGIYVGYLMQKYYPKDKQQHESSKGVLLFLGRHSLLIYLLHQPILYGLVFLVSSLKLL